MYFVVFSVYHLNLTEVELVATQKPQFKYFAHFLFYVNIGVDYKPVYYLMTNTRLQTWHLNVHKRPLPLNEQVNKLQFCKKFRGRTSLFGLRLAFILCSFLFAIIRLRMFQFVCVLNIKNFCASMKILYEHQRIGENVQRAFGDCFKHLVSVCCPLLEN